VPIPTKCPSDKPYWTAFSYRVNLSNNEGRLPVPDSQAALCPPFFEASNVRYFSLLNFPSGGLAQTPNICSYAPDHRKSIPPTAMVAHNSAGSRTD
jgi:hypothetical protein